MNEFFAEKDYTSSHVISREQKAFVFYLLINEIVFCFCFLDLDDKEEPRVLGLAMVPGQHILSIEIDDPER